MPYTVKRNDVGKFCVHKKNMMSGEAMGESFGCHDSMKEAVAQIGAIEESEKHNSVQFKEDSKGQVWFIGTYSNQFKDRQDQILSEQSHLEYIKWLEETGVRPQVTFYHMPKYAPGFWVSIMKAHELGLINTNTLNGIMRDFYKEYAIAETEKVIYTNGFTVVVGKVHEAQKAFVKRLQEVADELGMSHGFVALKTSGNIYDSYKSFEYSVLHRSRAANVYTDANFFGGYEIPMKAEEKELLNSISDGLADEVENATKQQQKELQEQGVEFKDNPETTPEQEVVEAEKTEETPVDETEKLVGVLVQRVATGLNLEGLAEALKTELNAFRTEIRNSLEGLEKRVKEVEVSEDEKIARQYEPNWQQLFKNLAGAPPIQEQKKSGDNPLKGWEQIDSGLVWGNTFKE